MAEGDSDRDCPGRGECDKVLRVVAPHRGDNEGLRPGGKSRAPRASLRHKGRRLGKPLLLKGGEQEGSVHLNCLLVVKEEESCR